MTGMTSRTLASFLFLTAIAAPAIAQPAAPAQPPAGPATGQSDDDLAAFDRDVNALFQPGGLTSDQAAARAASASPDVKHRLAEVAAAMAQREQAELLQIPTLRASAVATKLSSIPSIALPLAGQVFEIQFLSHDYALQSSLIVPLSDYVYRFPKLVASARDNEGVARLSRKSAEIDAGETARLAYYEWVRARLQVLIARRQLAQVQITERQEQALADAQRVSKADLMRVQSQEAEAEQTVDQLNEIAQLREEQLRLYIGAGDTEPLALGEDIRGDLGPASEPQALDAAVQQASKQRLDVKQLEAGIVAKTHQYEAERANGFPKLAAVGSVDDENPNPRFFPQTDAFKFTWTLGIQLTWQLSDTLIAETNRKRMVAEADELVADRENVLRGARIEILQAQQAVELAQRDLVTTAKGLAAAEESYRVRRELLNADRATAVELVDAQTDLTRARISALNARVDLRVALAQLTHALGNDIK
jgi:outer membrane protein TolC